MVSYINALPFLLPLKRHEDLYLAPPSTLNQMLQSQQLDCALCSSYMACQHAFGWIEDVGIAATKAVGSVHLYTPVLPQQLHGKRIACDPASATSVALLKLLCHHHWHIEPFFVTPTEPHEAWLTIGDHALLFPTYPGYLTIDLATAWYEMTQLPFVFALFTLSTRSIPIAWHHKLLSALAWSEAHLSEIVEIAEKKLSLPHEVILTYFKQITYRLGHHERRGFQLFKTLCGL